MAIRMSSNDEALASLEARQTNWQGATMATVLGISLLVGQYQIENPPEEETLFRRSNNASDGTFQTTKSEQTVGQLELFSSINRLYDQLLVDQTDLDEKAKEVLYSNLWNLYE